jgi:bifunctional polynucleotide phosphatase/kinase
MNKIKIKLKESLPKFELHKVQSFYQHRHSCVRHELSSKFAVFDLDGTLIVSSIANNWNFIFNNVVKLLQQLVIDGYQLVVISNQLGLSNGKASLDDLTRHLAEFNSRIGLPIDYYLASEKDNFRKPMTGLWDLIRGTQDVDQLSFFCGDAAGRKGDFNITDRYFAHNCKLRFLTPEEYFLDQSPLADYKDPYKDLNLEITKDNNEMPHYDPKEKYMIIMVGPMASGKSTMSRNLQTTDSNSNWVILNNDTIKCAKKFRTLFESNVKSGQNLIIDNTNPTREGRSLLITFAKMQGYKVWCYSYDFPKILSIHLNQMRVQMTHGKTRAIPMIAIHTYYKKLELPTSSEGFEQIITLKNPFHLTNCDQELDFLKYYNYHYDLTQR